MEQRGHKTLDFRYRKREIAQQEAGNYEELPQRSNPNQSTHTGATHQPCIVCLALQWVVSPHLQIEAASPMHTEAYPTSGKQLMKIGGFRRHSRKQQKPHLVTFVNEAPSGVAQSGDDEDNSNILK